MSHSKIHYIPVRTSLEAKGLAIINQIKTTNNILIITHQKPDGDAVGAVLAFAQYLDSEAKSYKVFSRTDIADQYSYLDYKVKACQDNSIFSSEIFDTIIVLDSSDLFYTGLEIEIYKMRQLIQSGSMLINIDHHETNELFGDINYVIPTASSTTEILYDFFKQHSIPVTKSIANCLLTGIITDTGTFSNGATTLGAFDTAADLLHQGARFPKIITHLHKNKSINTLRLWGKILSRLQKNENYDIAIIVIRKDDLQEYELDNEAADGLANFLNNLTGVKAALVLREIGDGWIKGSFRTTRPDVDVSKIAKFLGGGGHRKSSGFTIEGKLVERDGRWWIL